MSFFEAVLETMGRIAVAGVSLPGLVRDVVRYVDEQRITPVQAIELLRASLAALDGRRPLPAFRETPASSPAPLRALPPIDRRGGRGGRSRGRR